MSQYTYDKDNKEKEKNIRYIMKLKPEVFGYKGQGGIFCGSNFVSCEMLHGMALIVS